MSSAGSAKRIVLNSHRFFGDITPEVLRELPEPEDDPGAYPRGNRELYQVILNGGHKIVITSRIYSQYSTEMVGQGYSERLLALTIQHLQDQELIIRPRLPGGVIDIPGIRKRHRPFFTDAIRSNADYFLTENDVWLRLADAMIRDHSLMVVTPGRFISRESS